MRTFWVGFFTGIVATYALAIAIFVFLSRLRSRDYQPVPRDPACPEYPTVHFTHLTGIGSLVRGGDG